jgi:hypothetical protein
VLRPRPLQLLPFTAARPAAYPIEWHPVVCDLDGGLLFAAAFEGIGGAAAARHCAQHATGALRRALGRGADPEAALRMMWRELDTSFLGGRDPDSVRPAGGRGKATTPIGLAVCLRQSAAAAGRGAGWSGRGVRPAELRPFAQRMMPASSPHRPRRPHSAPQVKASVGAVGSAVLIDPRRRLCFASRLGAQGPFLSRTKGAFSAVRVEAAQLASGAPHRCVRVVMTMPPFCLAPGWPREVGRTPGLEHTR